jgi:hypothetical protein
VLLLEWSAPPELPYDHPNAWRWASPNWSPRREEFLRSQLQAIPEGAFRTQYLNQWVMAVDAWIQPAVWAAGESDVQPEGPPDVASVEVSHDGNRFALVAGWRHGDGAIVRSHVTQSATMLTRRIEELNPRLLLLPKPLVYLHRGRRRMETVSSTDAATHLIAVGRAIEAALILHDPADRSLTDDVSRAVAVMTESGPRLSVRKSTGPMEACKAMVWTVGELLKPAPARPIVRAG